MLQIFFLYLFVDILTLWYMYGVVCAYLATLVIVFSLQKFWTFQDYSVDNFHRQSLLYTLFALGSLALNVMFMYMLVDVFHFWHIGAQVIVVGVVGALSFLLNKMFTFKEKLV